MKRNAKRLARRGLLAAAGLLAALTAAAQTTAVAPEAATEAEAGRRVYVSACQRCHGIQLVSNGIGFDLRTFPAHDKERFVRSVNQGLRAMPAWSGVLKPAQVEALWAYVGTVNGWAEPAR